MIAVSCESAIGPVDRLCENIARESMPAGRNVVIFDLGGVLIDWDPRHLYRKLFRGDEAAMEDFLATVCTPNGTEVRTPVAAAPMPSGC